MIDLYNSWPIFTLLLTKMDPFRFILARNLNCTMIYLIRLFLEFVERHSQTFQPPPHANLEVLKKSPEKLEIRTSNLETSKICVKWKQQRQIICFIVFFTLLVPFVLPWVVVPWPWVGIPNRESHGQTVRVGRSALEDHNLESNTLSIFCTNLVAFYYDKFNVDFF